MKQLLKLEISKIGKYFHNLLHIEADFNSEQQISFEDSTASTTATRSHKVSTKVK
jgi:hypothetical protein